MEREKFSKELSGWFDIWKEGLDTPDDFEQLKRTIHYAYENGIDLRLKVPSEHANTMDETDGPFLDHSVLRYVSGSDDESLFFDFYSKEHELNVEPAKRLTLIASVHNARPSLLISSPAVGVFALFFAYEVTSLTELE